MVTSRGADVSTGAVGAPEGAIVYAAFTVCLKARPDTKLALKQAQAWTAEAAVST